MPEPKPLHGTNDQRKKMPEIRALSRIVSIPLIETSLDYASGIYVKLKDSNAVIRWGLGSAETTFNFALERTIPIISVFELPINIVDSIVCKSLDLVEEHLPVVTFPTELLFESTKEYMNNSVVKPVLKRADSMKEFGRQQAHHVLESKYTTFAAYRLDSALDLADKYIDQYLPETSDIGLQEEIQIPENTRTKAEQTIQHMDIISRKLKRRITERTLAEAKALKKQSEDTLQALLYFAELMARDPKAVLDMGAALWAHLSEDEPENQAPPQNLEQLTVMVSRELARRLVHFINYSRASLSSLPHYLSVTIHTLSNYCSTLAESIIKITHLEQAKELATSRIQHQINHIQRLLNEINRFTSHLLEKFGANASRHAETNNLPKPAANGDVQQINQNNINCVD